MSTLRSHVCPLCAGRMLEGTKRLTITYKGHSATFDMPGAYCECCGEGLHSGRDMRVSDKQLNSLKAHAEGLLSATEIRRVRKKLGLTQADAGRVIGGGVNAFNKYESGLLLPSQAASNLLRVLDAMPSGIEALRSPNSAVPLQVKQHDPVTESRQVASKPE